MLQFLNNLLPLLHNYGWILLRIRTTFLILVLSVYVKFQGALLNDLIF